MRFKFFWVPAHDPSLAEGELNAFLASHRVVEATSELVHAGQSAPGWAVAIRWIPGTQQGEQVATRRSDKVDYRALLDEPTFRIFAALRTWRKEAAAAEGIPIYSVATNEQLAAIARERCTSRSALERIEGFGQARLAKYAEPVLAIVKKEGEPGSPSAEGRDETGG